MRTRGAYQDGTTATAAGWRSAAAWLGVLVLACGRPDDRQGSSLPADVGAMVEDEPAASGPNESPTGDDSTDDADAPPPSGNSSTCPAPRPEAEPGVAWGMALDPASHECCYYANRDAAPDGWLRFDSDIECRCSIESCPSTIEEAEQRLCAVTSPPANVQRFVGCGLVSVVDDSGNEWAFRPPSSSGDSAMDAPRLVVAEVKQSDASSFDAGSTSYGWSSGSVFSAMYCDYGPTELCQVCGDDPATDYPPCQ
jgi:hypothetical protein